MKKHSIGSLLFIGLVLVIMYLPIAVVVIYSFNANTARIPIDFTGWTTAWYGKLFENRSGFGDALLLSVRVALWAVLISCVIGTLGAIGMAYRAGGRHSRLDTAMESLMSLPIMIPEIILGLAFMVVFNAGWWAWTRPCLTRRATWGPALRAWCATSRFPCAAPPSSAARFWRWPCRWTTL